MQLTQKQKIFCQEYIIDWNATRAAIAAGYSEKTAYSIGSENLTKPEVQEYIKTLQDDLEKTSGISRTRVLNEYMKIAFSSVAHLHNTWIEKKEFEELTEDQKACIQEISTKVLKQNKGTNKEPEWAEVEYVKIKLYDKQKALESICKMLGYDAPIELEHKGEILITRKIINGSSGD